MANPKRIPEATQEIFFDLEFYVPETDRNRMPYSFKMNPHIAEHRILGGVFENNLPLASNAQPIRDSFWVWNYDNEENTVNAIYKYLKDCWSKILLYDNHAALTAIGIGIERTDIPILYSKCLQHNVDTDANIFDLFFNIRVIDISIAALPFFSNSTGFYYPLQKHELLQKFYPDGVNSKGSTVWDAYDKREFELISNRTNSEINDIVFLWNSIKSAMKKVKTQEKRIKSLEKIVEEFTATE